MGEFVKCAKLSGIPAGEVKGVDVNGVRVTLCNVEGQVYAIGSECTHMGGPLDEGFLEGKLLQCPWHAGTFDVATGEAADPPASGQVPSFKVRVQGDDVEIEAP